MIGVFLYRGTSIDGDDDDELEDDDSKKNALDSISTVSPRLHISDFLESCSGMRPSCCQGYFEFPFSIFVFFWLRD